MMRPARPNHSYRWLLHAAGTRLWHGATSRSAVLADHYLKALESERKSLWATCRLKGLAKDTPERQRIAVLDRDIAAHKEQRKT